MSGKEKVKDPRNPWPKSESAILLLKKADEVAEKKGLPAPKDWDEACRLAPSPEADFTGFLEAGC